MARYFFDTSALVKHYHAEAGTNVVDRVIDEPEAELIIARLTLVETTSVFAIKVRTGEFDAAEFARLRGLFATHVVRAGIKSFGCSTFTTTAPAISSRTTVSADRFALSMPFSSALPSKSTRWLLSTSSSVLTKGSVTLPCLRGSMSSIRSSLEAPQRPKRPKRGRKAENEESCIRWAGAEPGRIPGRLGLPDTTFFISKGAVS